MINLSNFLPQQNSINILYNIFHLNKILITLKFQKYNNFFKMNSSTGFKKRNLLRPPSGLRDRQREFLKTFDISQTEPMIANQVKSQIARIQQQINELDKDKKIRSGEGSSLQKSYVITLKKWLRDTSSAMDKEDDDMKIMKYMGVDTYESGFRKLWKILSSLDNIITKVTELQIIQLLKYDQIFDELSKDSEKSQLILSTLSKTGFISGSFQISQVHLQRSKDIYSLLMQSKKKGASFLTTSEVSRKSETNELIAQLQKQNSKLSSLLDQLDKQKQNNKILMKELKSKEQLIKQNQNISNNVTKSSISVNNGHSVASGDVFRDLQDRYSQRLVYLSKQLSRYQSLVSEQKITISAVQSKLKLAEQQLKERDPTKGMKAKSGSYEQALLQEMEKMKKGFEKKIQRLIQEFGLKEKQMRKKQVQYKNQNEKVKWQKGLLLKKFDTLELLKTK